MTLLNCIPDTGFEQTKGLDISASYSVPMNNWGRLDIRSTGTYTSHFVVEPNGANPAIGLIGSGTYDCAGLFGAVCGVPTPHWRSTTRFTWVTPWKLSTSLNWRFIGQTKVDVNEGNALVNSGYGVLDTIDSKTKAMNYFDLSFQWKVKDGYTLRGGVNNVFDTNPPHGDSTNLGVYNANSNGNTYPGLYDTLGRNLFIGITATTTPLDRTVTPPGVTAPTATTLQGPSERSGGPCHVWSLSGDRNRTDGGRDPCGSGTGARRRCPGSVRAQGGPEIRRVRTIRRGAPIRLRTRGADTVVTEISPRSHRP